MSEGGEHYVCSLCGDRFNERLFALTRSVQRTAYSEGSAVIHVEDAVSFATYCSEGCQVLGVPYATNDEQVPIAAHPPGPGPIEVCAVCLGPVDMAQRYLDHSVSEAVERRPRVLQMVRDRTIALVRGHCAAPSGPGRAAEHALKRPRDESTQLE